MANCWGQSLIKPKGMKRVEKKTPLGIHRDISGSILVEPKDLPMICHSCGTHQLQLRRSFQQILCWQTFATNRGEEFAGCLLRRPHQTLLPLPMFPLGARACIKQTSAKINGTTTSLGSTPPTPPKSLRAGSVIPICKTGIIPCCCAVPWSIQIGWTK